MISSFCTERSITRISVLLALVYLVLGLMVGTGTIAQAQTSSLGPDPDKQVVLITGSTGGLGREVALRVAATGAHVIIHGRNVERGNEVVTQITEDGKGSARFFRVDLGDLNAVHEFAETIQENYDRLDILINNAGIATTRSGSRELSSDGYELMFAVNYLSGFLLTRKLLPLLIDSAPSRIINVASVAQASLDFDNVMLEKDYRGMRAYAQSKLAQIMFTIDLSLELEGKGVTAVSLHPATMMDTDMVVEDLGMEPRTSVHEGAEAVMHLVTGSDLVSGQYYMGLNPGRARDQAYDEVAREQLKRLSEKIIDESIK